MNLTWILYEFDSSKGILSLGDDIFVSYAKNIIILMNNGL